MARLPASLATVLGGLLVSACGGTECPALPLEGDVEAVSWSYVDWYASIEPCRDGRLDVPHNGAVRLEAAGDAARLVDPASCSQAEIEATAFAQEITRLSGDHSVVAFNLVYGGCFPDAALKDVVRQNDDLVLHFLLADVKQRSDWNGGCTLDSVQRVGVIAARGIGWSGAKLLISPANPDTCDLVDLR